MQTKLVQHDVTPQQLDRFAKLIYRHIGVAVSPQKITLLSNRLRRRMRQNGMTCYDDYYRLLSESPLDGSEWEGFLQEVTTHETYLFRDLQHWNWLRDKFVPELTAAVRHGMRPPRIRIWSAACSTGDEATTVACCLADRMTPLNIWDVKILGTDVGADTVRQARTLTFGRRAMHLVPESYRTRFFAADPTGSTAVAKPILRNMLQFEVHNLLAPMRQPAFDLIILKNVLIYFDAESKRKVLDNVCRALRPGGTLITGAADGAAEFLKDYHSSQGWLHRPIPVASRADAERKLL